jgi:hypothetical protein
MATRIVIDALANRGSCVVRDVVISGVGMTPFGRHLSRSMKDMGAEATRLALADAGIGVERIGAIFFGNCIAGLIAAGNRPRSVYELISGGYTSESIPTLLRATLRSLVCRHPRRAH